jgi:hypothetical protein
MNAKAVVARAIVPRLLVAYDTPSFFVACPWALPKGVNL